ncbi:hypothetical protein [Cytobacillus massiliigabonensis]|uniref:hypothetical protein n=1 Tax=Cytobacillus massiliigabonensis TaxID=1871011 RepID=UPI000C83EBB6|nr:hypothetical protein [Cytobacillus massiliigabonensis]
MNKDKAGKKPLKNMKRGMLAAAAVLVIGTSTTVAAAQNTDYFKMFFSVKEMGSQITDQVTIVSGIKMKVEESMSGGKSAIIIASFEKEDGSLFPKDAAIATLELDLKNGASYMVDQQVTEDGKKLIAMFDVDSTSSLAGEKVTLRADAIINGETDEIVEEGPFKHTFKVQDHSNRMDIDLTMKQQNEEVALKTVYVSAIGIGLEGKRVDGKTDFLPEHAPIVKAIAKDNTIIELKSSSTSTTDIGFKWQYSLDQDGNRVFLEKSKIKAIMINDQLMNVNE